MLDWCAVSGMLGHLCKEHGTGIHPPSALGFKDLRASWAMRASQGPGEGRGRRGGRRVGRTGGRSGNRREVDRNNSPVYQETGRRKDDMVVDGNGKDADMDDLTRKRLAGMPLEGNVHNNSNGEPTDKLAIVPMGTSLSSPPPPEITQEDPKGR